MNIFKELLLKWKCEKLSLPFFIKEHWPQYYPQMGYEFLENKEWTVKLFNHQAKVGDVVEVLKKGDTVVKYTIKRISYAPGSDWGVYSNKEFDLEFHSSYKL